MKRIQNYLPAILLIGGLFIFTALVPLIATFSGEIMDINSIVQAGQDIKLVMILTSIIILLMLVIGWLIYRLSLKHELQHTKYNQRDELKQTWRNNYWQGISTELVGAAITAFLFGIVLLVFQQYQSIENSKSDLILQMGSPDNSFAIEAARIAQHKGWLTDGTLKKVFLWKANLSGAYLIEADLMGADLRRADLTGTFLLDANLSGVSLMAADLTGAFLQSANLSGVNLGDSDLIGTDLRRADLTGALLQRVDLMGAKLSGANLMGADLSGANLKGSDLRWANLDNINWIGINKNIATLPDGTQWTSDTDTTRFTNPDHPEYKSTLAKTNTLREEMGFEPIEF